MKFDHLLYKKRIDDVLNKSEEEYQEDVALAHAAYEQYWQDFFVWGMKGLFGIDVIIDEHRKALEDREDVSVASNDSPER